MAVAVNQNDLDNSNVLYDADFELEEEKVNTSFSATGAHPNNGAQPPTGYPFFNP